MRGFHAERVISERGRTQIDDMVKRIREEIARYLN
jgi:ribosomal protein S19E (S16A)